ISGVPRGRIIRERLERARREEERPFMRLAGSGTGPARSLVTQRFFKKVKGIADTGFLVAFWNRNDKYHHWAVDVARAVVDPLLTCEAVLAETTFHTGDARVVLDFARTGLVQLAFNLSEHIPRIAELADRYRDRRPDLADLCLIRMSELNPMHSVITTD